MGGGSVRIANYSADPPACDAFHAYDPESFVLIPAIADSLAYVDIDGGIQPGLATSWKRVDPLTIDFELRDGVRFHNGEPFDADSVVATINLHIDPAKPSFVGTSILSTLKTCEKLGPRAVRITTQMPDAMFLNRLALFSQIYPKSILDRGVDGLVDEPVGTGAFMFERWTRGEEIVLRRNPDHWASKTTADELVFPILRQNEWVDRVASGDVDIAINVGPYDAFRARRLPGISVRERAGVVPSFFLFRNRGPLADRRVRMALNHALHKPLLIHVASLGSAVPQVGVAGEGRIGYTPQLARYYYDVELATRLLEEAGWAKGFKLRGIVTDASAGLFSVVREFLRRVNVELEAEIVPRAEWIGRVGVPRMRGEPGYDGDFTLGAFDDPISHTLFHHFMQLFSKGPFSSLENPEYDGRLFDAITTIDPDQLRTKVEALESYIVDQAFFLLTTRESVFSIARDGFDVPLPATGHFNYPSLWNVRSPEPKSTRAPLRPRPAGDEDVDKLLDATSFPGNLYLPEGARGLGSPALAALWHNAELHESRWRQASEGMIRLLVDQASAETHLRNVARSTTQIGILMVARSGRVVFMNDGYEPVTRCSRDLPLSALLWSDDEQPLWPEVQAVADRDGAWTGAVNMGREPAATRRIFLTVTRTMSELDTRTGYACTFTDYSGEEDRQRMKAEARTAALVQKALIPHIAGNPNIASYYHPASETGGDWFFVREDEERLTLMVGDVTGHGTAPALVTASVAGATNVLDLHNEKPERVLEELNGVVLRTGFGQYQMTCLYMQLEKRARRYRLASAAHPYPMFLAASGVTRARPQPGFLLGEVERGGAWPVTEGALDPGALVLLYTDGIVENTNARGQSYGMGRLTRGLEQLAKSNDTGPCDRILGEVVKGAQQFYGQRPPDDDVTLLLARVP